MYKLMVVDDEYNIRSGICTAIPWEQYGIEVVGEAIDGIDALEKFDKLQPDIVITDIYMDNMDGLKLAEALTRKNPDVKIIILSGYDEFEYAKKSIDLKVFSYILKPVLPNELISIVKKLTSEMDQEKEIRLRMDYLEKELEENKRYLKEKLLIDLLEGRIASSEEFKKRAEFLGLDLSYKSYVCLIFNIDGLYNSEGDYDPKEVYKLALGVKDVVGKFLYKRGNAIIFLDDPGHIVVLLGDNLAQNKNRRSVLMECIEEIRENIRKELGITVTVGVGGAYDSIFNARKSYEEAGRALDHKVTMGKDCVIHIDDVTSISGSRYIYPVDRELQVLKSIAKENKEKIRESMNRFFREMEEQNYPKNRVKLAVTQLFSVVARKLMDMGTDIYNIYSKELVDPYKAVDRFDTAEEINNWMYNLVTGALDELQSNRKNNVRNVIRKIQEYILQNYSDPDLSLGTVAEHAYLNPSYLSKLYKTETGESFVEYLTRVRIEAAKRLLKESNEKVSDIGARVGYLNAQYFCTIFKKNTGLSPVEYREQK